MTENVPLYSLVIRPPDDIIAIVLQMKDDLRSELGQWFNSSSSDVHITIKEFLNEEELNFHLPKIRAFCSAQAPEILRFNAFGHFGSRTFYIAPAPIPNAGCFISSTILRSRSQNRSRSTPTFPSPANSIA